MRLRLVLLAGLLARPAAAQAPGAGRPPGGTVSGVVRDSIAGAPLAGATVQLAAARDVAGGVRTVVSDSLGVFTFDAVPDGRYTLGFLHPVLDSLGIEPPERALYVDGRQPVHADLAVPSSARLRAAICGARATSVAVGIVRDARDGWPAAGVTVTGEWLEVTLGRERIRRRTARVVASTASNGWFALCGVPRGGTIALAASRGADSTAWIEVAVPAEGFLRRELYLGAAEGSVGGSVVAALDRHPLVGAEVQIVGGPEARADARGEWTLAGAPAGTRMLEVRAVGYYPDRRVVDVVPGAPPVRVALATLRSVLDTVKVRAVRARPRDTGFEQRRRSGAGRYLTAADVARRAPVATSDLFLSAPGIHVQPTGDGKDREFRMSGPFGACTPAFYLDGRYFDRLTASEVDTWMRPKDVAGIEIYTETSVPAELRRLPGRANREDAPCGSIVIWTR